MFFRNVAVLTFAISMFAVNLFAGTQGTQDGGLELKDYKDSLSYALGYNIGKNLLNNITNDSLNIDFDKLLSGFTGGVKGQNGVLSADEIQKVMLLFQQNLKAKEELKTQGVMMKNKEEGEAFLAENTKKEGIVTLPSGLQYKILKEGTGNIPKPSDTVKVHYTGKLIDGKVFDSSVQRGQPIEFPLNGVIKGWTEGLQHIQEGGKIILYIPPELGYGKKGAGGTIPPNATLIFEVELLKIVK